MRLLFILLIIWFVPCISYADDKPGTYSPLSLNKDLVEHITQVARKNLPKAKLSNNSFVGEETPEERKTELLPFEFRQVVVDRGIFSATAEWCGYEWKDSSFSAFMQKQRSSGKWTDKQLAYIGLIHGVTMGTMESQFEKAGKCTEQYKKSIGNHFERMKNVKNQ